MIPRVIPCLTILDQGVVKTVQFKNPAYIGDPRNAVRIFNEREVDELVVLDIGAGGRGGDPLYVLIEEIASEAFMPVAYGGGIRDLGQVRKLLRLGVEKVVLSTAALENPTLVSEVSCECGSQSTVVCLDVKRTLWGKKSVWTQSGKRNTGTSPVEAARRFEDCGAGELIVNSIERDGTRQGYDLEMISEVSSAVSIPVVACGGAGDLKDFRAAVIEGGASAVAAGSLFVQHGRHRAALISYPERSVLEGIFE